MMNKKQQVQRIFDAISPKYDLLNHLLSGGIDFLWRKKALKISGVDDNSIILDIACGTGDFSIAAKKLGVEKIFGADLSLNMLRFFQRKAVWSQGRTVQTIAEQLPFKDESFTNITVAFGVRNFFDIQAGFDSFYKILMPEGKVTILEFRMPSNRLFKLIYKFYFSKILPAVGRIVSKDQEAYTYLPESVEDFDKKIDLPKMLRNSGFSNISRKSMTFGIVQIVIGEK